MNTETQQENSRHNDDLEVAASYKRVQDSSDSDSVGDSHKRVHDGDSVGDCSPRDNAGRSYVVTVAILGVLWSIKTSIPAPLLPFFVVGASVVAATLLAVAITPQPIPDIHVAFIGNSMIYYVRSLSLVD
jgi:hypothetical protein